MVEQDMSHEVAIRRLVRKAGYDGRCDEYLVDGIDATRFRSSMQEFTYRDLVGRHAITV
eukprot:UN2378